MESINVNFDEDCVTKDDDDIIPSVGVPCFDSLENQKTRQHENQSLELQDLVLLLSERDLSNVCLQNFILCAYSIDFRLVNKCKVFVWLD